MVATSPNSKLQRHMVHESTLWSSLAEEAGQHGGTLLLFFFLVTLLPFTSESSPLSVLFPVVFSSSFPAAILFAWITPPFSTEAMAAPSAESISLLFLSLSPPLSLSSSFSLLSFATSSLCGKWEAFTSNLTRRSIALFEAGLAEKSLPVMITQSSSSSE